MMTVEKENLVGRCTVGKDVISTNKTQYKHWSSQCKSHNQNPIWQVYLRSENGLNFVRPQKEFRRKLVITRVLSGRMQRFDKGNLYNAVKPVEDALVKLGWLIDDAEKYCDLEVRQVNQIDAPLWIKVDYEAKIAIEIFDLPEVLPQ